MQGFHMSDPSTALELLIGTIDVPTVVLRHDLPDGSHHFDWLIAQDQNGTMPLRSFRIAQALHELRPSETLSANNIQDHRPAYLNYEGPVSGERGTVKQVARGTIRVSGKSMVEIRWGQSPENRPGMIQALQLVREKNLSWKVICVANSAVNR
jgi:hypothetical protein